MEKIPARKPVGSRFLRESFERLNYRFFNNEIPGSLHVVFMKDCGYFTGKQKKDYKHVEAFFSPKEDAIFIDDRLRYFPNLILIDLLHEMAHAKLEFAGYRGYPSDEGHGTQFHGEIVRLIKAGAYDSLL